MNRRPVGAYAVARMCTLVAAVWFCAISPAIGDPPPCHKCDTNEICDSTTLPPLSPEPLPGGFEVREGLGATDVQSVMLEIEPNFTTSKLTGTCTMVVKAVQAVSVFTIRLHSNFTITAATLNGNTVAVSAPVNGRTRTVMLDRAYQPTESFTLVISYNGTPFNVAFGSFSFATHSGTPLCASLSEPYYGHTWWPCKDGDAGAAGNNSDKFTLDVRLTVPDTMQAASNGVLQLPVSTLSGNRKLYHWISNYATPTYLLSIAATNYTSWTQTYTYPGGTMPVQFFIYPESDTPSNRAVWENTLNMMAAYRGVYGEYPFVNEKYGIYQFPFSGGMEHQTMTGQGGSGAFDESVTSHELGHQWWGDMITCKTWGDIWLNEGFATFTEAIWRERKPGGSMAAYHSWMANRRPANFSGSVYCYNVGNVNSIFDSNNSYRKGAWVLHMLRHMLGDTAFFQVLANYRAAYQYSAATTDDFAAVCAAVYGQPLDWFFDEWVYEPGAPDYEYGSQAVQINSVDYLLLSIRQIQSATYGSYKMPLDVQFTAGANTVTRQIWNEALTQYYVLPVPEGSPSAVVLDPRPWVLHPTPTVTSYLPGPPVIIQSSPLPGDALAANLHPRHLQVIFHTDVSTHDSDYTLVGLAGGVIPLGVTYDSNTFIATLSAASPLLPDHYTLTINSEVTANDSGLALDGEIASLATPFPSGNGQPGGDAIWTFDVTGHSADMDGDGVFTATDRMIFVNVLLGIDMDASHIARADYNGNGLADAEDIPYFVATVVM